MTTTVLPQLPQKGEQATSPPSSCLSSMSTLWIPLNEIIEQWAAFSQGAIAVTALLATGAAFHGLAWETKALRHYTWAVNERGRQCARRGMHWLERAVQDLDCAIDQWQQALSWLVLAGNDDEQQDPVSLDAIRTLMGQAHEHQLRRGALHRRVLLEYRAVKQQACQHNTQEGPLR
jgi:hypothetical protein